ncbi:MAG: hypothetical protein ACLGI2_03855 [Acidimicrobiia bacterium]
MNSILFLVAFLVLTLIGGLVLWLRERGPRSMEAHIREFERELEALSPETPIDPGPPPRRRPGPTQRGRYR